MSVSRSIGWSLGGQLATAAVSMTSTVILARLLTPLDFGTFAFASTIYAAMQWLLQMGMAQYVLREEELTPVKLNGAFAIVCAQGLIASLLVAAGAPLAGSFSKFAAISWVTLSVAVVPFLNAAEAISDALWLRQGRFASVTILQIAKALAQGGVAIGTHMLFGWGPFALVSGLLAASLVSFATAATTLVVTNGARPLLVREQWLLLRNFGFRSFLVTLAQIGSLRLPDLLVARLLGIFVLGHYNRATSALDLLGRTLSGSIMRVAAPRFYKQVYAGTSLPRAIADMSDLVLFFLWPPVAGIAVLSIPLIHLLYGPQWDIAAHALAMLCLAFAIDAARTGGMEILMVRDRVGLTARIEAVHAVYAITLVLIAAPFGLWAVLIARVADSLITTSLYLTVMYRFGALPAELPSLFGRNALLAFAASGPALLLLDLRGWPARLDFGAFALAIGGGIAAWLLALFAMRHPFALRGVAVVRGRLSSARKAELI